MILFFTSVTLGAPVYNEFDILYVDDDNIDGPWDGTLEYPYKYIEDAVENANYGDTIRVYAGVYDNPESNVYITKTLSVIGNGSAETFIERPVFISSDDVLFRGFTIVGIDFETLKKTYCIHLENSNMCDINNNTIASGLCGIELYDSHNNTIEYNIIKEREEDKPCIYLFSSNTNMIRKNLFDMCGLGIYVDYCHDIILDDNNFRDCDYSISLISSGYCVIKNNVIQNGGTAMTMYLSNNNSISGNTISNLDSGMIISSSDCNTIIDNIIMSNFDGIELQDSSFYNTITKNNICKNINSIFVIGSHNNITGNIISNNSRGLNLGGSNNIVLDNNISSNNDYGIRARGAYNIISNNIISCNEIGIYGDRGPSETESNNVTVIENTIISNNKFGILLYNCSFYTIKGNTISNNENGIELNGFRNTIIISNIISSNSNDGIILEPYIWAYVEEPWNYFPFVNNQIIGNLISYNGKNGIFLSDDFRYLCDSKNNTICENNIINNKRDAFIINAFFNQWQYNYWTNGWFLPKPIFGIFYRYYDIEFPWVEFPWVKFDWHPAIKPYNIEV